MPRRMFGDLPTPPPTPHDPRDDLNHLAAGFDIHFEPETLRRILADTAGFTGEAWLEIREAIEAAIAAAEHSPPPRAHHIGEPIPEGTKMQVFASPDDGPILGEVVTGPDGHFDLGHIFTDGRAEALPGTHRVFLKVVPPAASGEAQP